MKRLQFIAFILFTAFISSCSSDESGDSQNGGDYFNFTYDNKTQKVKSWEAQKQGDFIEVMGVSEEGIGVDFKFNIYGNLFESFTHPTTLTSTISYYTASKNFSSNTFTFTLVNLNTTEKTVEVKFSGKVYENEYDYQSKSLTISGSFKVPYKEIASDFEGQGTFAKIDGKDWHGLVLSSTIENMESQILYAQNDGEYTIGIVFPDYDANTGTYNFTNDSAYRISFQKYDIATHENVDYTVSGTVNYTMMNDFVTTGTFNLIATHPVTKAKVTITNGTFKERISN